MEWRRDVYVFFLHTLLSGNSPPCMATTFFLSLDTPLSTYACPDWGFLQRFYYLIVMGNPRFCHGFDGFCSCLELCGVTGLGGLYICIYEFCCCSIFFAAMSLLPVDLETTGQQGG